MADDDRSRILALLEAGRIDADQAVVLLDALQEGAHAPPKPLRPAAAPPPPRPPAQLLRITIDAHDGESGKKTNVNVNVPLTLARFAARFMPAEARTELEAQGIDLVELLSGLGDEVPDGPLVDLDATDPDGKKTARIRIEVV